MTVPIEIREKCIRLRNSIKNLPHKYADQVIEIAKEKGINIKRAQIYSAYNLKTFNLEIMEIIKHVSEYPKDLYIGTIQKNLPITKQKRKKQSKYPFWRMEIGDSFYSETVSSQIVSHWVKTNNSDFKFKVRKEGVGKRVWRVE